MDRHLSKEGLDCSKMYIHYLINLFLLSLPRCPRFRSLSLCLGGQRLRGQQHSDSNGVVTGSDSNGGCGGGTTGGSSSLTVARSSQGGVSGSSPDTATTARSSLLFEPDRDRGCHQAAKVIPRRDVIVDINGQSRSAVSASSSSVASAKGLILASSQEELQTLMINSEIQDSQC